MNRIVIGCLALLIAGCCKNDLRDCRLVGTWKTNDNGYPYPLVYKFEESGDVSWGWYWNGVELLEVDEVKRATWTTPEVNDDDLVYFESDTVPLPWSSYYTVHDRGDSLVLHSMRFGRIQ